MYPVSGGFYTYSSRFIDPSWGFAMGWNYVMQWAVVLPFELTVCSIVIQYWDSNTDHIAIYITVFWILITLISVFGALGYAEEEFLSSFIKLTMTVVFMIIAIICVLGGGPDDGRYNTYQGAKTWYEPGAFNNGFVGFCSVFVTAAFSFAGTELVGLAAAESKNPVKNLPGAVKQVFWRITLFYILGLFFIGLLIPYDDSGLMGEDEDGNKLEGGYAAASPFVLVGKYAGLTGFDHAMNTVILVSVMSIGMSCVYGGSRTLTAMAQTGYAPRIFTYIDKSGRPLFSTIAIVIFGPLAYVVCLPGDDGDEIFGWLLALSGLAALFTWGSICLAHIRFRAAWKAQGHTLDEIPFRAAFGVIGSWVGLILCILVIIAQVCTPTSVAETICASFLLIIYVIIGLQLSRRRSQCGGLFPQLSCNSCCTLVLAHRLFLEEDWLAPTGPDRCRLQPSRARLGCDPRIQGRNCCLANLEEDSSSFFLKTWRMCIVKVRLFFCSMKCAQCRIGWVPGNNPV